MGNFREFLIEGEKQRKAIIGNIASGYLEQKQSNGIPALATLKKYIIIPETSIFTRCEL